jgi:WD40 repeat protein
MHVSQRLQHTLVWMVFVMLGPAYAIYVKQVSAATPPDTATQSSANAPRLVLEAGGHSALITGLIFTADGRELLSVSHDKTIRIWAVPPDGRRATLVRTIRGQIEDGPAGVLWAVALSPPDTNRRHKWLAVGGSLAGARDADRYAVRVHDYQSGEVVALLRGHTNKVITLAFSPNGRWLASAGKDNTVCLWDMSSLQGQRLAKAPLVLTEHTDHIYDLDWSPTGDRLASASYDRSVGLWDTTRLAQERVTLIKRLRRHRGQVRTVAFHPAGTILASGSTDKTIRLWRASDGKALKILARADHKIAALAFSPNGQLLLAGNIGPPRPQQITVFAYPSGRTHRIITAHRNTVIATAFHPNDQWAASGGGDDKEIVLWDANTGAPLSRLEGHGRTINAVGFSRDGQYISWGTTTRYSSVNDRGPLEHRFDLHMLQRLPGGVNAHAAVQARDKVGKLSLATERPGQASPLHLKIRRGWKRLGTITRNQTNGYWHSAYTLTPDGRSVLSGGLNGHLWLYALDGTPRAQLVGHTGEIKAVAASADGRWALSGSADQTLKLWDLSTLSASGTTRLSPTLSLFPTDDGEWIAWTSQGFFTASAHGAQLIGYSINRGLAHTADYIVIEQMYERFFRPDLIHAKLQGDPEKLWQKEGATHDAEKTLAVSLPPRVSLVAPAANTTVTTKKTEVRVRVSDQGGGLGKVVWKMDGVAVAVDTTSGAKSARLASKETGFELAQQLELTPGHNTIKVIAYDRNDLASKPVAVTVTLEPPAPPVVAALPKSSSSPTPAAPSTPPAPASSPTVSTLPQTPTVPAPQTSSTTPAATSTEPKPSPRPPSAGQRPSTPAVTATTVNTPDLHLLVVGINRYRDRALQLRYAVPDGQAFTTAMHTTAASLFEEIRVTTLFDDQATLAGVEAAFREVAQALKPHDVFMLYIAGHGVTLDGRYYFLPQDFRYYNDEAVRKNAINQDHLQRWLAGIPARKSLILIDTCESGSFSQSFVARVAMRGMAEKTAIAKLTRATGRATIVASTDSQPALEGYKGHGVFTYVLLQALSHADTRFGNRDGYTGLFELASFVQDRVPEITQKAFGFEQIPQIHIYGSDFPIGMVKASGS